MATAGCLMRRPIENERLVKIVVLRVKLGIRNPPFWRLHDIKKIFGSSQVIGFLIH
jgi:hypothetical protein